MIGLGDEYTSRSGGIPVGTEARHSDLAERLIPGQQPVMAMQSGSVMSVGEVVQPWHYVTFLEALESITGIEGEWDVGSGPGARAIFGDLEPPQ